MFANGLILSHILYHAQVYGGCSEELLSALQIQQNRAARLVCRLPWRTRTSSLLQQMGWMNVRQIVSYYSVISIFKTQQSGLPKYIHNLVSIPFKVGTRMADSGGIRDIRNITSRIGMSSFIPRTVSLWNRMPATIRMEESMAIFSTKLRVWITNNI